MVLAMASQQAFGQELPQEIIDVLVFALTLEHIEDAFYRSGLEAKGLIPDEVRRHLQPDRQARGGARGLPHERARRSARSSVRRST